MADTTKLEKWRSEFQEWEGSGLSQKRYCEDKGISICLFAYWRKRLRDSQTDRGIEVACYEVRDLRIPDHDRSHETIRFETTGIRVPLGETASVTVSGRITITELMRILEASRAPESDRESDCVSA